MKCPACKENKLRHMHDTAHGIYGTHISGTERFVCECGFNCSDALEGEKLGLFFVLDVPTEISKRYGVMGNNDGWVCDRCLQIVSGSHVSVSEHHIKCGGKRA